MSDNQQQERFGQLDAELTALFAEYRAAIPDPEPGANFGPRLWQKIEARRNYTFSLRRFTQGIVTAAAAASLLMGVSLVVQRTHTVSFYNTTYLEALAADQGTDQVTELAEITDPVEHESTR